MMTDGYDKIRLKGTVLTAELRGKIIGIDALVRNALVVAEGECALRLIGIEELAADALSLLAAVDPPPAQPEVVRPVGCPLKFYEGMNEEQQLNVTRAFFAGLAGVDPPPDTEPTP